MWLATCGAAGSLQAPGKQGLRERILSEMRAVGDHADQSATRRARRARINTNRRRGRGCLTGQTGAEQSSCNWLLGGRAAGENFFACRIWVSGVQARGVRLHARILRNTCASSFRIRRFSAERVELSAVSGFKLEASGARQSHYTSKPNSSRKSNLEIFIFP